MAQLEFVTSNKIENLEGEELYDFIVDRINENSILVLEKDLDAIERMELIARGLERATSGIYAGIKVVEIKVSTGSGGFLRGKSRDLQFNLITPGNSQIEQKEEGYYSIITEEGAEVSASVI